MKIHVLFCLCLLYASAAFSQAEITEGSSPVPIAPYTSYLEDKPGTLSIADVITPDLQKQFVSYHDSYINFGVNQSPYWLQVVLLNKTNENVILELGTYNIDSIAIYERDNSGNMEMRASGSWKPYHDREINSLNYEFLLNALKDRPDTIYIRAQHARGLSFNFLAGTESSIAVKNHYFDTVQGIYFGFMILMILYNLFIFVIVRDRSYLFYVVYVFFMTLLNASLTGYAFEFLWPRHPAILKYEDIFATVAGISGTWFASVFLHTKKNSPLTHRLLLGIIGGYIIITAIIATGNFTLGYTVLELWSLVLMVLIFTATIIIWRNGYTPAKYFLFAWSFLIVSVVTLILKDLKIFPTNVITVYSMQIGSAIEALLFSFALADRFNMYKNEKEELVMKQNIILESKVKERTTELSETLKNLRETQQQLIRQEKLTSLGQVTTGIAQEIENPLLFINDFSRITNALVDQLLSPQNGIKREDVLADIKNNLEKISYYGDRAGTIVKSILVKSGGTKEEKQSTDINQLCEECIEFVVHAMQVSHRDFVCKIIREFDPAVKRIHVVRSDIYAVILHILKNSMQAVYIKQQEKNHNYFPEIGVATKMNDAFLSVTIHDNGPGIPDNIRDRIFEPFFTTGSAGVTGLGLSQSYDIISAHGGKITMESETGLWTKFTIELPC